MARSNFEFLRKIDRDVFREISSAEKISRTNFENCVKQIRVALEALTTKLAKQHRVYELIENKMLSDRFQILQSEVLLREAGYLKENEQLKNKPILPEMPEVTYRIEQDNKEVTRNYYTFLRQIGNAGAHYDTKDNSPRLTYENTVLGLKGFYILTSKIYKRQITGKLLEFDEDSMPIEDFFIEESYVPDDYNLTKCEKEFLVYREDSFGEIESYAVLRMYRKNTIRNKFLARNRKCFVEASKMSVGSRPEGMAEVSELTGITDEFSPYYIICYAFPRKPEALTVELVRQMTLEQRLKFCKRLADCLYNLHYGEEPIEHRMLNYECIFACKKKDEWIPFIIKFDFAKLESLDEKDTVLYEVADARKSVKTLLSLKKYMPLEQLDEVSDKNQWTKGDIYSLGVLFSDILAGKFEPQLVDVKELKKLKISKDLLSLIDDMRSDFVDQRPDISYVKEVLDVELA